MSTREYEVKQSDDVLPVRKLARIAIVSVVVGVVCVAVSAWMEVRETRTQRQGVRSYPAAVPTGIVEQTLIGTTSAGLDLVAAQRRKLESYGWVDRGRGIARIPIDRAMDLTVEHQP